ncbi:MAG: cell division protein FtsH, partial [Peptococcaceae bacterium]|nr:cell division protein FtsH [Peptococcaceae bacterium]
MTRTHLKQQIIMMLGGRVAEEIVLHEISTGASNDIECATGTIRRMITEWGMSDELGTITFGNNNGEQVFLGRDLGRDRNYSEAVAYSIDKEVKRMMDECHAEATRLLTENLDKLTLIAETLKEREVIQADEFIALMEGRSLDELDRQKEEILQEQKGAAEQAAEENSAAVQTAPAEETPVSENTAVNETVSETPASNDAVQEEKPQDETN